MPCFYYCRCWWLDVCCCLLYLFLSPLGECINVALMVHFVSVRMSLVSAVFYLFLFHFCAPFFSQLHTFSVDLIFTLKHTNRRRENWFVFAKRAIMQHTQLLWIDYNCTCFSFVCVCLCFTSNHNCSEIGFSAGCQTHTHSVSISNKLFWFCTGFSS